MTEPVVESHVLSREEVDALLDELAASRREGEQRGRVFLAEPGPRGQAPRYAPVRRALERFGAEYGKQLSSTYQKRITWTVGDWQETSLRELGEVLLPLDEVVVVSLEPGGELAFVVLSRPLLFAWLCLAYGGRRGARYGSSLARPYTRIERRFLRRIVGETLAAVDAALADLAPLRSRVVAVEDRRVLLESDERALVASFEVRGFDDVGRFRIALPLAPFGRFEGPPKRVVHRQRPSVRGTVLEMSVPVRAEAGIVELPLSRLAQLRPGDVIPLEGPEDGTLVLRVGGKARFRAVRGSVGHRLAVQVIDRL